MPRFRKKPVEIEAIYYDGSEEAFAQVRELAEQPVVREPVSRVIHIQTLEGGLACPPDYWVIKGVAGEIYPCRPDVFTATYEEVPT